MYVGGTANNVMFRYFSSFLGYIRRKHERIQKTDNVVSIPLSIFKCFDVMRES